MAGAGTSREAIVREQEKEHLENFLNDIPLPKDVYFEFASDAWRSIKLKEFVAKAPMFFDYRIMTEIDESTWGGEDFERPFFYVPSCGVGGCKQKGWPNCSGAWSYISDVRCRIAYAVHLVKHGAHGFTLINALCWAFDYEITRTIVVFESFTERAQTLLMKIKMRGLLVYSMFQIRVNALVLCDCATLGCTVIVKIRVAVIVGCCMTPTSSPIIGSSVTRQQLYPNDPDGVPIGLAPLQKAVTDIAIVCKYSLPSEGDLATCRWTKCIH